MLELKCLRLLFKWMYKYGDIIESSELDELDECMYVRSQERTQNKAS